MQVAIFGGSFDPPHIAHIEIVKEALNSLDIEKIVVMPTFINPLKSRYFADPKVRYKWLRKIFKKSKRVWVSDFEISQNRAVFAIESVEYLSSIGFDVKYFIIGADNLKSLDRWIKIEKLKELVEFIVVSRDGVDIGDNFKKLNLNIDISSTSLRENLELNYIPKEIIDEVEKIYKDKNAR